MGSSLSPSGTRPAREGGDGPRRQALARPGTLIRPVGPAIFPDERAGRYLQRRNSIIPDGSGEIELRPAASASVPTGWSVATSWRCAHQARISPMPTGTLRLRRERAEDIGCTFREENLQLETATGRIGKMFF